jgi:hypothetical protein
MSSLFTIRLEAAVDFGGLEEMESLINQCVEAGIIKVLAQTPATIVSSLWLLPKSMADALLTSRVKLSASVAALLV